MSLEQGNLLHSRYRIVDILGQGGMGSVYRAIDENLGVEVAVKENLFTTEEYARQFRLEAVILAGLRQPNMPRVTDHFVIGSQGQYLVMDYIEGEDLRQRMERVGTISDEEAIIIGAAMCDALGYLHTRKPPILHRDLKPGNVKIAPDGKVYLVDFGLAKIVLGAQQTSTGARAMTPGYSPPEQYGSARTDPRSDIYSLAATLYAALTGFIPEDALSRVMDNVQLTPIRKRNPRVSRKLAACIEKAMAAYPEERFQTTEEFKQALLNASGKTQRLNEYTLPGAPDNPDGGVQIQPSPEVPLAAAGGKTGGTRPRSRSGRRGGGIGGCLLSALFVLILLTAASLFLYSVPTLIPAQIAGLLPPGIIPQPTPTKVPATPTPSPSASATATQVVVASPETATTTPSATRTPRPTLTLRPSLTPTPTRTLPPTASPTATLTPMGGAGLIAFASNRTGLPQIYLMNFDGSNQRALTTEAEGACQPAWSPDGRQIAFISPCRERKDSYTGTGIYIMNTDGSGKIALPASAYGEFDPAWSPDGTKLAFTSLRDGYQQIYTIDLRTLVVTRLTDTTSDVSTRQPAWSPDGLKIAYTAKRVGLLQVWEVAANGANPVQVVRNGSQYNDFMPSWAPDGKLMFYSETNPDFLSPAWLMSIEPGSSQRGVRIQAQPPVMDAQASPDGFWLIFESSNGANTDIYRTSINGGNRTRLTDDPGLDFDPTWQPPALNP